MVVRSLVAALVLSVASIACAAAPRAQTAAEVEHLLAYLLASGCQFHRNGEWHDAAAAAQHLRDKYEAMLQRDLITSTESFIERGASRSSMSGQPYLVRCAQAATLPSGDWFSAELRRYRQSAPR
jgi:Family of unknown function (DUF5329)